MILMTATEASRGFSALLDGVERGEVVTITRGKIPIAEVRPAARRKGSDLRRQLESRPSRLAEDGTLESDIAHGLAMLSLPNEDPWAGG